MNADLGDQRGFVDTRWAHRLEFRIVTVSSIFGNEPDYQSGKSRRGNWPVWNAASIVTGAIGHMVLVGLPIAFAVRRFA
jgi:hypothetical protein